MPQYSVKNVKHRISFQYTVLFLILSLLSVPFAATTEAAYLRNVPTTLTQPNGEKIECFASGDEFFNWLHDADGYTIIQNPDTGYYTYTVRKNGDIGPSEYIVNRVSPQQLGLEKELNYTPEKVLQIKQQNYDDVFPAELLLQPSQAPKTGTINNIAVFIRFSDEAEFTDSINLYENMFNSTSSGANSQINYFREVSYSQLTVRSNFYPPPGSTVVSYRDSHPRGYYQPYSPSQNPNGYLSSQRTEREHTLLKNAVDAISSSVPANLNVDSDGDGNVDSVTFIISGNVDGWSSLLWPHRWNLYTQTAIINGKKVNDYSFQLQTALKSAGVGVICHEMFHVIGSPDLYHYSLDNLNPVWEWDIMEYSLNPPQHMGAYMKYRYGNWISSLPEITTSGTYTLNPLTSSTNNVYKIASPRSTSEYFIVEYRKKTGTFESSLPAEGLLVYRINSAVGGGNRNGPPDEVYIYRPDGTLTANGTPDNAPYRSDTGRTRINDTTNPSSFLSGGSAGGLNISNVGAVGDTISFTVTLAATCTYTINPINASFPAEGGTGTFNVTTQSSCAWTATSSTSTWLTLSTASGTGSGSVSYTVAVNPGAVRTGTITIASQTFTVTQQNSNITLGVAVDNTSLMWRLGGNAIWYGQSATTHDGVDAAQSGMIAHSQESWMETTVTGPEYLSFWWKVSSEANYDHLSFYIDGVLQNAISGDVNWQQKTYWIGPGTHTVNWRYSKDGSVSSGSDTGWVDQIVRQSQTCIYTINPTSASYPEEGGTGTLNVVTQSGCPWTATKSSSAGWITVSPTEGTGSGMVSYTVAANAGAGRTGTVTVADRLFTVTQQGVRITFGDAMDNASLTWATGGNANWAYQTVTFDYGGDAARSGAIDNNQSTWIQTTVAGPGWVSFYWKVRSEVNYDYLMFYIDGALQKRISGDVNWQRETYHLSSGYHTLKWVYAKDEASRDGEDAGWLDRVSYCAQDLCGASPVTVVTNSVGTLNTIKITDMSGSLSAAGGTIAVNAWDSYGRKLFESESAVPLRVYNHKTTIISGTELASRFSTGSPSAYEFSIYSSAVVITNVKNSSDGTLNIPTVYTSGVTNFVSNSIGPRNSIKITDMSGSPPATGASITVKAWDTNGNELAQSGTAPPILLYRNGTTILPGIDLMTRFPHGSPMLYEFSAGSSKIVITNVKSSADGTINIPSGYTKGTINFVANSVGPRNQLKITDMSGTLSAIGAPITVLAWDMNGNFINERLDAVPLKLYNHATTIVSGPDLASRFPTGSPMSYEFSIGSPKVLITNIKNNADGSINIPYVYTSGITNFVTNSINSHNTITITDMSGSLPARAFITISAKDANGNVILQSGNFPAIRLYNHGTTTITGSELVERFRTGLPVTYEFSIDSPNVVITNLTSCVDDSINIPIVYTSGVAGGI